MVSSSILSSKVHGRLYVTVFIPSHEHSVRVEWESTKGTGQYHNNRVFTRVDGTTSLISVLMDRVYRTINSYKVPLLISLNYLVLVDS